MIYTWFLLAAIAGFFSNIGSFIIRFTLRKPGDATTYAWWFEVVRLVIFSVWALFDFKLSISVPNLALLLLLGIIELPSIYIMSKMHTLTELSISTLIMRLRLVWIPIIAFFLIGEKLLPVEYLGIFILFLGLSITTAPQKIKKDKGIQLAILGSLVNSFIVIIMKAATSFASTPVIMVAISIPSAIFFPLLMKNAKSRISTQLQGHNYLSALLACIANMLATYLLLWSFRLGPVGKISAIYQSMMLVSILAGIFILKEYKNISRKLLGSFIVLVGALLLI